MQGKSCAKRGKEKEQLREARLWNGDEKRGFASEWWSNELKSYGQQRKCGEPVRVASE